MIALVQRVTQASVEVEQQLVGQIKHGLLVLLGVEKHDDQALANKLLKKVVNYRIFNDDEGKMNLSLLDVGGELLVVSQFTLAADTKKGLRPGFSTAATPSQALELYQYLVSQSKSYGLDTQTGIFGADMLVSLTNDGPVTFSLTV